MKTIASCYSCCLVKARAKPINSLFILQQRSYFGSRSYSYTDTSVNLPMFECPIPATCSNIGTFKLRPLRLYGQCLNCRCLNSEVAFKLRYSNIGSHTSADEVAEVSLFQVSKVPSNMYDYTLPCW